MSQTPVIAESKGNANIDSSVTSRDTFQDVTMEPNIAAPAVSRDTELNDLPFMQLAVEIRLQIYRYLFIALPSLSKSIISAKQASESVMREMKRIWDADQWKTIASKRTGSSNCASIGPTPHILRTCKPIPREATPILYSGNVFQFYLGGGDATSHPGYKECSKLEKAKVPGCAIQVFTQVLKCHVPGVHQVKICRGLFDQDQYEKEPSKLVDDGLEGFGENESDHTTKSQAQMSAPKQTEIVSNDADFDDQGTDWHYHPPSAVRREEQEAMYKATADMVQEITWLDQLNFAGLDLDVPAFEGMKQLEALVKVRR